MRNVLQWANPEIKTRYISRFHLSEGIGERKKCNSNKSHKWENIYLNSIYSDEKIVISRIKLEQIKRITISYWKPKPRKYESILMGAINTIAIDPRSDQSHVRETMRIVASRSP